MPACGRYLPKTPHSPEPHPSKKSCDQLPFRLFIGIEAPKIQPRAHSKQQALGKSPDKALDRERREERHEIEAYTADGTSFHSPRISMETETGAVAR